MRIKYLWKATGSGSNGCPALYQTGGGYVVQGKTLDAETRRQLRHLTGDEDAVFVPADVLDRLRDLT